MSRRNPRGRNAALSAAFALVAVAGGCHAKKPAPEPPPAPSAVAVNYSVKLLELPVSPWAGLSGFTRDQEGQLWSVPERQRVMLPITLDGDQALISDDPIPLSDIPKGMDTESIAWLTGNRFVLGTERQKARPRDVLLFMERRGKITALQHKVAIPYAPWGLTARVNKGLEGVCHADGSIVTVSETVGNKDGKRFGPVARYDLAAKRLSHHRVFLTTETGKLSGMDCRVAANRVRVLAVERHFGVSRLVTFEIPHANTKTPTDVHARLVLDLIPYIDKRTNVEGVVWLPDGRILLMCDNDSGGVTGSTQTLIVTPGPENQNEREK